MADALTTQAWIAPASALGGVLVGLLGPWITSFTTSKREREARREARADREMAEQHQLLLDLQKALHHMLRAASTAHSHDSVAHRDQDIWAFDFRNEKVLQAHNAGQMKAMMLVVRVQNSEVRKLVQELRIESLLIMEAKNRTDSDSSMLKAVVLFNRIMELTGELIRSASVAAML